MKAVKVDGKRTNFPWAIVEDHLGIISQSRFATEAEANVAYKNYSLGRRQ